MLYTTYLNLDTQAICNSAWFKIKVIRDFLLPEEYLILQNYFSMDKTGLFQSDIGTITHSKR